MCNTIGSSLLKQVQSTPNGTESPTTASIQIHTLISNAVAIKEIIEKLPDAPERRSVDSLHAEFSEAQEATNVVQKELTDLRDNIHKMRMSIEKSLDFFGRDVELNGKAKRNDNNDSQT
ncbi:hypothetical protein ACOME3_000338 [Neoechinorhynchus agilis]